jgi:hypothetical protein
MKRINIALIPIGLILFYANLFLLLIYFAQGVLYPVGTALSQLVLLICFLILGYFLNRYLIPDRGDVFGLALIVFLLMNTIYFILGDSVVSGRHSIDDYKRYLFFILMFYAFYVPAKNNLITSKILKVFIFLLLLIYVAHFIIAPSGNGVASDGNDFVNNDAYLFVSLLPLIGFFMKRRLWYLLLYSVLMYFIILGSKRGAIVAFVVGSLFSWYYLFHGLEKKNKSRNIVLVLIGLSVIAYIAYDQYIHYYFLQDRIQQAIEGNSSRRDIIFADIWHKWYNSDSVLNMLIGYGFNGSRKLAPNYAHNDWLELLAGQGILGVLVYLLMFYGLIDFYVKNKRFMCDQEKSIYLTVLSMWFVQSLFSMGYAAMYNYTYTLSIGYLFGVVYNRKIES